MNRSRCTEMQMVKTCKEAEAAVAAEEQITALKRFYHSAQTKVAVSHNPFDDNLICMPFLTFLSTNPCIQYRPTSRMLAICRCFALPIKLQNISIAPNMIFTLSRGSGVPG